MYNMLQNDDCGNVLQHKLNELCHWSEQLRIAEKKCACMSVCMNNSSVQLYLNNSDVKIN